MIGLDGKSIIPLIYVDPHYIENTGWEVMEATYQAVKTYLAANGYALSFVNDDTVIAIPGCRACGL